MTGLGDLDRRVSLAAVPPFAFDIEGVPGRGAGHPGAGAAQGHPAPAGLGRPGGLAFPRLRAVLRAPRLGRAPGGRDRARGGAASRSSRWRRAPSCSPPCSASPTRRGARPSARRWTEELERSAHLDREAWLKVSRTRPARGAGARRSRRRWSATTRCWTPRATTRRPQDRPGGDPRPGFGDAAPRAPGPGPRAGRPPAPEAGARAAPAAGLRRRPSRPEVDGRRRSPASPAADRAPRSWRARCG